LIRSYFKIAWRNLLKDRQFTLLNLAGLASGLACAFIIYLWVNDEMQIDKFHQNNSQLYQVMQNIPLDDGSIMTTEHTPDLLAKSLADQMPEVQDVAIVKYPDEDDNPTGILSYNGTGVKAKEIYATPNFFKIFSFQLLQGNKDQVLSNKSDVLLSDLLAMKLFHTTQNLIGKIITWDRGTGQPGSVNGKYIISGIFESPSANSSLRFDLLFPHAVYADNNKDYINWQNSNPATYVLLKSGTDIGSFNKKVKGFIKAKYPAGSNDQKWAGTLFLQRYSAKYLQNHYENGAPDGGRIEYVKLFSAIAIFILLIACINFMNLSTAKASRRMKEVGIKKVMGASRGALILQYISESMLMALLSLLIAIMLVWLLLPAFREITGKELSIHLNASLFFAVAGVTITTGIISGSYPALYLSGFRPVAVLKGKLDASAGESWVRKWLVVFQFAISVILIVSVIVVYKQTILIQTKNLGYSKDNIIRFSNDGKLQQDQQAFLTEARTIPGIVNASDMEGDMFGNHSGGGGIHWPGQTQRIEFSGLYVDYNFMETMGLQMKEGRMFSRQFGSDSDGVIFNEAAIAAMKLKDPVGKSVILWGRKQQIIGVVKDFHYESLYKKVGPFFISYRKNTANLLVKIQVGTEKETIALLGSLYKKYNPGLPFEYSFLDEDYNALYSSEQRVAVLSRYFAGIAIVISCLGLFGVAAFTAQKRQKEIGIRKVVGASVSNIAIMFSKDFLKLVLIALLFAFPVAWWAMHNWLQSFAYRVNVGAGIFLIAGIVTMLITLITISFQSIKAALANPVNSLRSE
jgi:ABC-type antimicrobial peptide transport system permease subunit